MDTTQIEVLPDGRIVLVLHDGPLPRAMSTHEAKLFGHDKVFGGLLTQLKEIQKDGHEDKAYLLNYAVRVTRATLEVLR
jgi:hypothetical protein